MSKQTVSLAQIYNAKAPLEKFSQQNLPIKVAFKLLKTRNVINREFEILETQRVALVKKYDPSGEQVPVEARDAFIKEWLDFVEEKQEIDIEQINMDNIPTEIQMSVNELINIAFIFDNFEDYMLVDSDEPTATAELVED